MENILYAFLFLSLFLNLVFIFKIVSFTKNSDGNFVINNGDPEKDIYSLEFNSIDKIERKKYIKLNVVIEKPAK